MDVDTEYVITSIVQYNTSAEGGFDANCTLCAPGAVRDDFASGPAHCCLCPPRHDWMLLSNCYTVIRSARISLIFVCGFCTIKIFTMI